MRAAVLEQAGQPLVIRDDIDIIENDQVLAESAPIRLHLQLFANSLCKTKRNESGDGTRLAPILGSVRPARHEVGNVRVKCLMDDVLAATFVHDVANQMPKRREGRLSMLNSAD
mgnify:CR=1 FL=1